LREALWIKTSISPMLVIPAARANKDATAHLSSLRHRSKLETCVRPLIATQSHGWKTGDPRWIWIGA
jgi:hypothetical protein